MLTVLDDFHPQIFVDLSYPSSHSSVNLGNSISPSNVSTSPNFEIHSIRNADSLVPTPTLPSNVTYTLVLTDPDATSRSDPVMAEMCHWIVTDISIQEPTSYSIETVESTLGAQVGRASNPVELVSYLPPSPPPNTGSHRYVFVLLASKVKNGHLNITKPVDRPHWGYGKVGKGVRTWAEENELTVLGANFFYAKSEEQ
ncbi:hypothetical protein MMC22_003019 [Lobaria immixta]|nr:hypothetical protein [Lobaria immixta]